MILNKIKYFAEGNYNFLNNSLRGNIIKMELFLQDAM